MKIVIVLVICLFGCISGQYVAGPAAVAAPTMVHTGASAQYRNQDNLGNYAFGYNENHASGGTFRRESGDILGAKFGSYGLRDADGRMRIVNYIADAAGFRVAVASNEPGVLPQSHLAASISKPVAAVLTGPAVAASAPVAHLHPAHLHPAHLHPAHLHPAHLHPAHLHPAHLQPAHLHPAHLQPAHLHPAHLHSTHLHPAHPHPVYLHPAHPHPVHLHPAHPHPAHLHPLHAGYEPGALIAGGLTGPAAYVPSFAAPGVLTAPVASYGSAHPIPLHPIRR